MLTEAADLDPDPGIYAVHLVAEALPENDPRRALGHRWAFNGQIPPPLLRAPTGTTLSVRLENRLNLPLGLRFSGTEAPNATNGAPLDLGQGAPANLSPVGPGLVPTGGEYTYTFALASAGTFIYRPHLVGEPATAGGLVGALVVGDAEVANQTHEITWIFDAPGEDGHATPEAAAADPAASPDGPPATAAGIAARRAAAGRGHRTHRSRWTVNGAEAPVSLALDARPILIWVVNASSTRHLALRLRGLQQVAGDGAPFGAPLATGPFVLGPGDRGAFVFDATATPETGDDAHRRTLLAEPFSLNGGFTSGEPLPLVSLVAASGALPPRLEMPASGAGPSADPSHTDLLWVLTGTDRTGVALINGKPYPQSQPTRLARGARPIVELRNLSSSHRAFAVQGQRFEVLSINGEAPPAQRFEDTIDVPIRAQVRLQLHADNPGLWQLGSPTDPHARAGGLSLIHVD